MLVTRNGIQYELTPKKVNYDTNLNIRVSSELMQDLHKLAKQREITFARIVRTALEEEVKNNLK